MKDGPPGLKGVLSPAVSHFDSPLGEARFLLQAEYGKESVRSIKGGICYAEAPLMFWWPV